MKLLTFLILLFSGHTLAQKDFSIYPLPSALEFGTNIQPLFNGEGYALEFSPAPMLGASPSFSMQYVYPSDDVFYSMKFIEPDPTKKYSMYTPEPPEPTVTLEVIPEVIPLER